MQAFCWATGVLRLPCFELSAVPLEPKISPQNSIPMPTLPHYLLLSEPCDIGVGGWTYMVKIKKSFISPSRNDLLKTYFPHKNINCNNTLLLSIPDRPSISSVHHLCPIDQSLKKQRLLTKPYFHNSLLPSGLQTGSTCIHSSLLATLKNKVIVVNTIKSVVR